MRPWLTSGRLLPGLTVRRLLTATPAARPLNKTMSAETADNAGTPQLKLLVMENIKEFPRGINSDQVISGASATAPVQRASWSGPEASSLKLQASSKPEPVQVQASSIKRQASSPEAQASSFKPQAASSEILEPRNKKTEEVFLGKGPRAFTMINVFSG